ncbi:long-chain fatty acid--CoA ligase [Pseudonocardia aurantiaca]|uniref:Class I adenylate-forming enzyme family protein n=1 Tax=Pseudonocardia aurantiaca TaxID=75290 RepID=A0ABW4FQV0_9PSEU
MELVIGNVVADAALLRPRGVAATLRNESITFAELDAEANRMAHALRGLGVERGHLVSWWTGSTMRSLFGVLACARLGAVFAPLSPAIGPEEARTVLDYVGPRLVVTDRERAEAARATGLDTVTVDTEAAHDLAALSRSAASTPVATSVHEDDPHILYMTSGSTGTPKGVLVSHRATYLRSSPGAGTFGGAMRGDRGVLSSFPLSHYGGWHYVIEAWLHRTAIHLVPHADAGHLHAALSKHQPTAMYCIPAVWERVLAEPGDLTCLQHADSGTSTVAVGLVERLRARAPQATTTVLYGSSEAGPMAALRHWQITAKPGSVGRAISPGVLVLAEDGEILHRGPTLMNGYLYRPEATAEALAGGWYHSGDLGEYDDDGFLYITGRKREIIRSGGESVAPVEVEEAIRTLPGVADVAVIGLPDECWGEIVTAVVVPEAGARVPDLADLREGLAPLARYKHPRRVVITDAIPRTAATGQVMRSRVRAELLARGTQPATP